MAWESVATRSGPRPRTTARRSSTTRSGARLRCRPSVWRESPNGTWGLSPPENHPGRLPERRVDGRRFAVLLSKRLNSREEDREHGIETQLHPEELLHRPPRSLRGRPARLRAEAVLGRQGQREGEGQQRGRERPRSTAARKSTRERRPGYQQGQPG